MARSELRNVSHIVADAREKKSDLVIIDVAGGDSVSFFEAFRAADLVVIPFAPAKIESDKARLVQRAAHAASCGHVASSRNR